MRRPCAWCERAEAMVTWRKQRVCPSCCASVVRFRRQLNDELCCDYWLTTFRVMSS